MSFIENNCEEDHPAVPSGVAHNLGLRGVSPLGIYSANEDHGASKRIVYIHSSGTVLQFEFVSAFGICTAFLVLTTFLFLTSFIINGYL